MEASRKPLAKVEGRKRMRLSGLTVAWRGTPSLDDWVAYIVNGTKSKKLILADHSSERKVKSILARVQGRHPENLPLEVFHERPVAPEDLLGAREHGAARAIPRPQPPRDLEDRGQPDRLGPPHATHGRHLRHLPPRQLLERAELREQLAGDLEDGESGHACPELNREELGVGKRGRALVIEPLSRALLRGPFALTSTLAHAAEIACGARERQCPQSQTVARTSWGPSSSMSRGSS